MSGRPAVLDTPVVYLSGYINRHKSAPTVCPKPSVTSAKQRRQMWVIVMPTSLFINVPLVQSLVQGER